MKEIEPHVSNFGPILIGRRCILRPLMISDISAMISWPPFTRPEDLCFNESPHTRAELEVWVKSRLSSVDKSTFAVLDNEKNLIGRISLTLVDKEKREGLVGIRVRSDRVNEGWGTDALKTVVNYWFEQKGGKLLTLDVSSLNLRAIWCYENVGFKIEGYHFQFEPLNKHPRAPTSGYVKFWDMRLTFEDWKKLRQTV